MTNITEILFEECRDIMIFRFSDGIRAFGLFLFLLSNTILLLSLRWWWINRRQPRLVVRSLSGMLLTALYSFADTVSGPLHWFSLDRTSPINSCGFHYFFLYMAGQFYVASVFIRIILYQQRFALYKAVSKSNDVESKLSRKVEDGSDMASLASQKKKLLWIYYFSTNEFARNLSIGVILVFTALSLVLTASICPTMSNFGKCPNLAENSRQLESSATFAVLIFFIAVYSAYRTRFFPDPYEISKETLFNGICVVIAFAISYIVLYTTDDFYFAANKVNFAQFMPLTIAAFINMIYSIPYQVYLSRKSSHQSVDWTLKEVLAHPGALNLFRQHVVNEMSQENLDFYLITSQWKNNFANTNGETRNKIAKNIYRKWISPDATVQVNISQRERTALEEVMNNKTNLPATFFDGVCQEVFLLMESDSFFRFKNGPLYRVFIGLTSGQDVVSSYGTSIRRRLSEL